MCFVQVLGTRRAAEPEVIEAVKDRGGERNICVCDSYNVMPPLYLREHLQTGFFFNIMSL